jgi:hypothetical protein
VRNSLVAIAAITTAIAATRPRAGATRVRSTMIWSARTRDSGAIDGNPAARTGDFAPTTAFRSARTCDSGEASAEQAKDGAESAEA